MKWIMVWRGQWMPEDEVKNLTAKGALMLDEERINVMLNTATEQGEKRGKQAGRYEMRQDIEAGRIDTIPGPGGN